MSAGSTKRKTVAELLQSIKKARIERDTRTWTWAENDLRVSFDLTPGDKIYVRYEYEELPEDSNVEKDIDIAALDGSPTKAQPETKTQIETKAQAQTETKAQTETALRIGTDTSESRTAVPDTVIGARAILPGRADPTETPALTRGEAVTHEEIPTQERVVAQKEVVAQEGVVAHEDAGLSEVTPTSAETAGTSEETAVPGEETAASGEETAASGEETAGDIWEDDSVTRKVVWWPGVIRRLDGETARCVREEYELMKATLPADYQKRIEDVLPSKGDAPVWLLEYEGRDSIKAESVKVFFLDDERLVHLHPEWSEATYKNGKHVTPQEIQDDPILDPITAIKQTLHALQIGRQDSEWGTTTISIEGSSDLPPEEGARIIEKFAGVLRAFVHEMVDTGVKSVSAAEVFEFFGREEEPPVYETPTPGNVEVDETEVRRQQGLQGTPFPRTTESDSSKRSD